MRYVTARQLTYDGWTDWIQPRMKSYKMACCDCGLVHALQFKVIKCGKGHKVIFRAKRSNRSTAAHRRRKHAFVPLRQPKARKRKVS